MPRVPDADPVALPGQPHPKASGAAPDASGAPADARDDGSGDGAENPEPEPVLDPPRVHFDNEVFDFGVLHQMEEASHTFVMHNLGDQTLVINNVKGVCGCTGAAATGRTVDPGGIGSVVVNFRSGTMRGVIEKKVMVDSNDPARPRVELLVKGEIKAEVDASPRGVHIGELAIGETFERSVVLKHVEDKGFKVLGVSADHPAIHLDEPVRLAGEPTRYSLTIRFGPVDKPTRVNSQVTVRTDREHSLKVPISVYGKVVDPAEDAAGATEHEASG
jgi:hypothetical protein